MPDEKSNEIQALDAVAAERGAVLGFRACEDSDEVEPVFLRVAPADPDSPDAALAISIEDRRGLSLGTYLVPRERLQAALESAADRGPEPVLVPTDWQA